MSNWIERIEKVSSLVEAEFKDETHDELNWKASADKWSIAQNLDHLVVINTSYFPIFQELVEGNYRVGWLGKFPLLARTIGKQIIKGIDPSNTKKSKTFPIWEPDQSEIEVGIVNRFLEHQEELKVWNQRLAGFITSDNIIHSPANRKIVYDLKSAWEIIVLHEMRHFLQGREVKGQRERGVM